MHKSLDLGEGGGNIEVLGFTTVGPSFGWDDGFHPSPLNLVVPAKAGTQVFLLNRASGQAHGDPA
jgi:hypothetical protein